MNRVTADTNIFIHAADPDSPNHSEARQFFATLAHDRDDNEFVLCELVLIEWIECYSERRAGVLAEGRGAE